MSITLVSNKLEENVIRNEIKRCIEKSGETFKSSTIANLTDVIINMVDYSENPSHRFNNDINVVRVMHTELSASTGISKTRIAELLRVAKNIGLITIKCIDAHAWKIARNVYTFTCKGLADSIRQTLRKHKEIKKDDDLLLQKEVLKIRKVFELKGVSEEMLNTADERVLQYVKSVSGVFKYYKKVLKTIKKENAEIDEVVNYTFKPSTTKSYATTQKGNFNNYQQRTYDFVDLEKRLLDWENQY